MSCWYWGADDLLVLGQARVPTPPHPRPGSPGIVETPPVRPAPKRPGRILLAVGSQMPPAERRGAVPILRQDPRHDAHSSGIIAMQQHIRGPRRRLGMPGRVPVRLRPRQRLVAHPSDGLRHEPKPPTRAGITPRIGEDTRRRRDQDRAQAVGCSGQWAANAGVGGHHDIGDNQASRRRAGRPGLAPGGGRNQTRCSCTPARQDSGPAGSSRRCAPGAGLSIRQAAVGGSPCRTSAYGRQNLHNSG